VLEVREAERTALEIPQPTLEPRILVAEAADVREITSMAETVEVESSSYDI
jgi:hypothetical protein